MIVHLSLNIIQNMPRTARKGFAYYKAETDRFQDIKIRRLKKRHNCAGYAVYQYILNEIYRVEGCYMEFSEDEAFDCSEYWTLQESEVQEIVDFCAEIGLFDSGLWKQKRILTARSIQERYVDMCRVAKRRPVLPEGIALLDTQAEEQPTIQTAVPDNPVSKAVAEERIIREESRNIPENTSLNKKKENLSPSTPPGNPVEVPGEKEEEMLLRTDLLYMGLSEERCREALFLKRAYPRMPLKEAVRTVREDKTYQFTVGNYISPLIENYRAKYNAEHLPKEEEKRRRTELEDMGIPFATQQAILSKAVHAPKVLDEAIREARNNKRIKSPTRFILSRVNQTIIA